MYFRLFAGFHLDWMHYLACNRFMFSWISCAHRHLFMTQITHFIKQRVRWRCCKVATMRVIYMDFANCIPFIGRGASKIGKLHAWCFGTQALKTLEILEVNSIFEDESTWHHIKISSCTRHRCPRWAQRVQLIILIFHIFILNWKITLATTKDGLYV